MTDRKSNWPRRLRIRSIRRNPPDIPKLGKALIELAQAQAEKEAEAEFKAKQKAKAKHRRKPKGDAA